MNESSPKETYASLSDETLMAFAAKQDKEAFATLVRRHQAGLVNFFRRMGDSTHAEDLAQETFIRLFKYRKRYRPKATFATFLYLLGRRAWIDHYRAVKRRKNAYEKIAEEEELRRAAPSAALEDAKARASEALARLPPEMRMVVVMSIYQGFKYREIADVLGIPLGTVKTRMFHALKKLRKALADENES